MTTRSTTRWPLSLATAACPPSPPATSTTPRRASGAWPRRWRRSGPAAASPSSTGGSTSPGPPTCAAATRWPGCSRGTRERWRGRRSWRRSWRSTSAGPRPRLPKQGIPDGHTPSSWLRELTEQGFRERYAGTDHERAARARVDAELEVICRKDFAGYFVIVHDIVAFARSRGILCQGRGSAASSAVCFALGITAIDAVYYQLPFERFISEHREEEPDIDVDFDSDRREEVIQWVYDTYGRHNAAQVCNIVSYRPRMAVRDAAKALGFSTGQQDAWSKTVDGWSSVVEGGGDPRPGGDARR
ncbi:hypothetical protein [Nocardioides sp. TF02-7]|uniref:hypothetical protein n=1 Tax=Nocardioides sp. TF02-7 TaxID=2917724 RepID=UPI0031F4F871